MLSLYDIKKKTQTFSDGVPTTTWTPYETLAIEVQPLRLPEMGTFSQLEIEVGGEKFTPTFKGWITADSEITASNRITNDSGTVDYLVLRSFRFEDHIELALREVE